MTAEFLLDAIGQIDDDLILNAEKPVKLRPPIRQWVGMAAVLTLCVGLSVPLFWRTGNKSNASGEAAPSASGPAGGFYSQITDSTLQGSSAPSDAEADATPPETTKPSADPAEFFTVRGAYGLLRCIVDALPDGCRPLGSLSLADTGIPHYPATVDPDYAGCSVWESADGSTLYLQLPSGNWLAAGLIQAYD